MNANYDLNELAMDVLNFGITEANTEKLMNLSDEDITKFRKILNKNGLYEPNVEDDFILDIS